jgi:hypothetical protein
MTKRAFGATAILSLLMVIAPSGCGDDSGDGGDGGDGTSGSGAGSGGGRAGAGGGMGNAGEGGTSGRAGNGGASGASGEGGTSGEGGASGAGGMGGGGEGGTGGGAAGLGGNTDDTPISERESDGAFECAVGQELVNYKPTTWGYTGGNIVASEDAGAWVVRSEAEETAPFTYGPYTLLASPVDAQGTIGDGTTIPADDAELVTSPRGVAIEGGLAALWIENGGLWFAALDEEGAITIEPRAVVTDASLMEASNLQLARNAEGRIAAVWSTLGNNIPVIAVTDDSGADATAIPFDEPSGYVPRIAGTADGFAMLWRSFDPDFMDPSNVLFARLDATGAMQGDPVQLTDFEAQTFGATFGGSDLALLPVRDGYLVAWGEGEAGDFETSTGAYSVLRVQALSSEGEPIGESALIAPRVDDVDQVEPSFVPWDDDTVALLWASGSHIYICAGCVPDHSMHMQLIDPATFTPRSDVVTVEPEMGGLLGRSHAVTGSDLLVAVGIQFHVHFEPGFTALHCE